VYRYFAARSQSNPSNHRISNLCVVFHHASYHIERRDTYFGVVGAIVWTPIAAILPRSDFNRIFIFLTGSAIGSSGYWLLVRLFWLKSLRRADWLRTVALCVAATLLAALALGMFDGYVHGVAKLDADVISPILTVAWWFAFSISLYWSEMSAQASKSTQAVETVT
jgi:hypothetical protein